VQSYANINVSGPSQDDLTSELKARRIIAYVSPTVRGATVVWHEDLASQESIARELSGALSCPALLVMTYATRVLLYQLYEAGELTDTYVSEHVEELLGSADAPRGNPDRLCEAFNKPSALRRVTTVLTKPAKDDQPFAYAANRHGELCSALGLPSFAVGSSYAAIQQGNCRPVRGSMWAGSRKSSNGMYCVLLGLPQSIKISLAFFDSNR
jgi:hypothetical protein